MIKYMHFIFYEYENNIKIIEKNIRKYFSNNICP